MMETLTYDLLIIGRALDDVHSIQRLEVTCVYGKPAVAPHSLSEIPFMIKDVRLEGKIPDFAIKQFLIESLGGEDVLKDTVLMRAEAGSA